jgi:CubicO group peptidase (beta-lactamase class C family)
VLPEIHPDVTVEHLLTHTSGLDGDFFHDTGRGDDCLATYVTAIAARPLTHPPGATHSYSNGGFSVAGRVVEVLTGKVWDTALRDLLITPLGLTGTWTLPEDVLRFRAATGHLAGLRPSGSPQPPDPPAEHGFAAHAGVYQRTGARITVRGAELVYENASAFADLQPPMRRS